MNAPVDISHIRLETPRILLRGWQQKDLGDLLEYSRIPEVGQMAGWNAIQTEEEAREVLDSFLREPYTFALEHRETGKVIGSLCLDWLDPDPELPDANVLIFGYDLHKDFWGQGLMPESIRAAIPYCFETLKADYIRIGAYVWNRQSQRVAEKCGFRYWKTWEVGLKDGRTETEHLYLLPNPTK